MAKVRLPTGQDVYTLDTKKRNYTFLVYPDSAPDNWIELLDSMQIPAVISPLHESDPESDFECKPHYHVVICMTSPIPISQALTYCYSVGGVPNLNNNYLYFVVGDQCKMLRYLCHLDEHGKKPLYDTSGVIVLGPLDYEELIKLSGDDCEMLIDITFFVREQHITNFSKFQYWTAQNNPKWFRLIAQRATFYTLNLIKSERYNVDE